MNNKPIYVTFGEKKIENEFEILKEGKFEDKQLYDFIDDIVFASFFSKKKIGRGIVYCH